jgi:hypothetical protein
MEESRHVERMYPLADLERVIRAVNAWFNLPEERLRLVLALALNMERAKLV